MRQFTRRSLASKWLFAVVAAGLACVVHFMRQPTTVELDVVLQTPGATTLAVFCDDGRGYSGQRRLEFNYDETYRIGHRLYRFRGVLPCDDPIQRLRVDPVWALGKVTFNRVMVDRYGPVEVDLASVYSQAVKPLHNVARLELEDGRIAFASAGHDPHFQLLTNLQAYYRWSPTRVAKIFVLYLAVVLVAASSVWWLSTIVLRTVLGAARFYRLTNRRQAVAEAGRALLGRMRDWFVVKQEANVSAMVAALGVAGYGNWLFGKTIYGGINLASATGFVAAMFQFVGAASLVLFLGYAVFHGRRGRAVVVPSLVLLGAATYAVDAFLYGLNGMHLEHGLRILFDGGITRVLDNLKFTKLSPQQLSMYQLMIIALLIGCVVGTALFARVSRRLQHVLSPRNLVVIGGLSLAIVAAEQVLAGAHKPSRVRFKEQETLPLHVPFVTVHDQVAEYRIKMPPYRRLDKVAQTIDMTGLTIKPTHIYLFILESVRQSVVGPEITPHLDRFRQSNVSFAKGLANGNSTHYGWYGLVNSRYPVYWETFRALKDAAGAAPLWALRRAGFKIHVHTAKDLRYLGTGKTMFGLRSTDAMPTADAELIDFITERPAWSPERLDRLVTDQLIEMASQRSSKDAVLNIIFFDSTHYPYRWGETFDRARAPVAGTFDSGPSLGTAKRMLKTDPDLIWNRYVNAVAYNDQLFGEFIDALKERNLFEESLIIAVGDHGQQFDEHGFFMHGHTLFNVDMRVPLYVHLPGKGMQVRESIASHIDIMPTIMEYVGFDDRMYEFVDGRSLLGEEERRDFSLGAAAGYQNTPYMFDLETHQFKVLFEVERLDPLKSKLLRVRRVLDQNDIEYVPGEGSAQDYSTLLDKILVPFLRARGMLPPPRSS